MESLEWKYTSGWAFTFKLQSPKALNNIYAWAGILTYSPLPGLPILIKIKTVTPFDWVLVMELTAAGQLRIYTIFPFNPGS